tara:strand:- start:511 stop:726 length:216 start_codon:yes stop_codon:yes gene_type:complete
MKTEITECAFPLTDASDGMTLRDYFAAKAMQGHIASCYGAGIDCDNDNRFYLAEIFYNMADAMIKAKKQIK